MEIMKNFITFLIIVSAMPAAAQQTLSLDSCRALALSNNKLLGVAKIRQDVAKNMKKSARTKYLPDRKSVV